MSDRQTASEPMGRKVLRFVKKNISVSAFIVIVLLFSLLLRGRFLNPGNIQTILEQSVVTLIVSFGLTFVILSGSIDLSVGSVVGLSGVLAASVFQATGNFPLTVLTAIFVGLACGAFNGGVHAYMKIPSFITTLGTLSIARAITTIYSGGSVVMIPFESTLKKIGLSPWLIILGVVFLVISLVVQKYTVFGRYVRMIGGDENVSRLCGIKVDRIKLMTFTMCGVFAALGGLIQAARIGSGSPTAGTNFEMDCISAVVLGGTPQSGGFGGVGGTVLGALVLSILANGLVLLKIPTEVQQLIKGFVLILAVFMSLERDKIGIIK